VPNDEIQQARKLRMTKARQYGGTLVKSWTSDIDLIDLESHITYEQLLKWLKNQYGVEEIPPHIHVVNTKFIGECLELRSLLDSTQHCFQVAGVQSSKKPEKSQPSALPKASSFQVIKQASSRGRRTPPPPLLRNQSAPEMNTMLKSGVDELAQAIEEAKDLEYLSFNDSQDGFGNDPEASLASLPYEDTRGWQKNFSCMHAGSVELEKQNPNARTIDILNQMSHYYDNMGDQYRSISYRKAVTTLKKEYRRITTMEDALALRNVGQSIAEKIVEIAITQRLKKLDALMDDPLGRVLQVFTQIYGVGMMQASRWVGKGYRSLDDLRTNAKLTDAQTVGIEHYDDFLQRIPRTEVKKHGDYVLAEIKKLDNAYEITIGGSYRRGKPDSGDIDLIITKPGAKREELCEVIMNRLIPHLLETGYLKVKLSGIGRGDHGDKWHGCSCIPGTSIWRRIDFLLVPWDEMGAALIYFTGNDIFNRSIRLLASKKKMCLNQTGLYGNVIRKRNREKLNEGELLESKSEKRIFEILGVPWRLAEDRNL
jgi:DNA polymerase IV